MLVLSIYISQVLGHANGLLERASQLLFTVVKFGQHYLPYFLQPFGFSSGRAAG